MTVKEIPKRKGRPEKSDDYINYRLRNARKEMGLNIINLGRFSSVNISQIYNYEQLKRFPGKTNAKKISDILKKDPDYLFPEQLKKLTTEIRVMRYNKEKDPLDNAISLEDLNEDQFPKSGDDPVEIANHRLLCGTIIENLHYIPQKSIDVINARYGLKDGQDHTLKEIGKTFKLSRERIRQIESRALSELRKRLYETPSKL